MAMRCARQRHVNSIVSHVSEERNTQVRGFILGHLLNLQQSDAPEKKHIRYLLENTAIPRDFKKDIRKYSRNIDLSYFAPTSGVGAEAEANVIYAPGSYVPRSVDLNFTAALGGALMNIGEVGARFEGLEPVLEDLFGPEGYLRKADFSEILNDIKRFLGDAVSRRRRSIDIHGLSNFLSKAFNSDLAQVDVFARYMGQEIAFASMAGDLKGMNVGDLNDAISDYLKVITSYTGNLDVNFARTGQLYLDYAFPTIQGTPFKIQFEGTAVVDLKVKGRHSADQYSMEVAPSLSFDSCGFVGFDGYLSKTGIKSKNSLSIGGRVTVKARRGMEVEVHVDVPNEVEVMDAESETFLMKSIRGRPEQKILPASTTDVRFRRKSCITFLESILGLRICYDINVPDVFRCSALPFGPKSVVKLRVEKSERAMRGYLINAGVQDERNGKTMRLKVSTPGSSVARDMEAVLSYEAEEDRRHVYARLSSSSTGLELWTTANVKENQKDLQLFATVASNAKGRNYGVKVSLQNRSEMDKQRYDLAVYYSRQAMLFESGSKVFEGMLVKAQEGPVTSLDILYRTKNALRNYVALDSEVSTEVRNAPYLSVKVKQFRFHGRVGGWKVITSFSQTRESDHSLQYLSAFKFSYEDMNLMSAQAITTTEGTVGQDFVTKSSATVTMGSEVYKSSCDVYCSATKLGGTLEVIRSRDNAKIAYLEALLKRSGESVKTTFVVDLPGYAEAIGFESSVVNQGPDQYMVSAFFRRAESPLFSLEGPVQIAFWPEVSMATNLTLNTLATGSRTLFARVALPPSASEVSFAMRNERDPVFAFDLNIASPPRPTNVMILKFALHDAEYNIQVDVDQGAFAVGLDAKLFLKSSSPRRIKGFISLDFESRELKASLLWDADRDEGKMVSLEGQLLTTPGLAGHVSIPGNLVWMGQTYRAEVDLTLDKQLTGYTGSYGFNLTVITPHQRSFALGLNSCVLQNSSGVKVHYRIHYKSLENVEYNLKSAVEVEYERERQRYSIHSWANATASYIPNKTLDVELNIKKSPEASIMYVKTVVSFRSERKPLAMQLVSVNQDNQYSMEWKADAGTPVTLSNWNVTSHETDGIQSMDSKVDVTAIRSVLRAIVSSTPPNEDDDDDGRHGVYRLRYHKPSSSTGSLLLQYLPNAVQAEADLSPSPPSLAFCPDRDEGEAKYEIGIESSQGMGYGGHIRHPSLAKDLKAEVRYGADEGLFSGNFTLDIFPDKADEITVSFESYRTSTNSIKIVLTLSSKATRAGPRITAVFTRAYDTVGVEAAYQKTPSSPASYEASLKYDRFAPGGSGIDVLLRNEEGVVAELVAVVRSQDTPICVGWKSEVVLSSSLLGYYDVYWELCRPGFLQLRAKKRGTSHAFVARLGYKGPRSIEGSVSRLDSRGERAVLMAKVAQASPSLVSVDVARESEEWAEVKDIAWEEWQKVVSSAQTWIEGLCSSLNEVLRLDDIRELPVVGELASSAGQELFAVYRRLRNELLLKVLESPVFSGVADFASWLFLSLAETQKAIEDRLAREIVAWEEAFSGLSDAIKEVSVQMLLWMETGVKPEAVQQLEEKLEQYRIFKAMNAAFERFAAEHQQEYQALLQVVDKAKRQLHQDLFDLLELIVESPSLLKNVDWFLSNYNSGRLPALGAEKLVGELLRDLGIVSVDKEGNHYTVHLPLYRPLSALTHALPRGEEPNPLSGLVDAAWQCASFVLRPIGAFVRSCRALLPGRLADAVPPFAGTATAVGGTEMLTFDGALLRVPRTPCEVVLASCRSGRVVASHPRPSAPARVAVTAGGDEVTVEPDFSVRINGRGMAGSHEALGDVSVRRSDGEIAVASPDLSVRVLKEGPAVTVEASGWAFGRVAGLLGSYDGEAANDWVTPSGERPSSGQELLRSWQLDQRCSAAGS